ncbi:hypothetical protein [Rhodopseudomonas palustris]|uniref:Uncharacterized protein n=1 Tax=Rhodopseudomonas palustris (strain BisB18) TaxID=316056 RepID=Q218I3_RHOPB
MPSPEWIWGIAIVILGGALAYGLMRARGRTPTEKRQTDIATKEGYRAEDLQQKSKPLPE